MLPALIGGVLSVAVAGLLLLAPAAFGAPPANDDFASREVLSGSLPIEVSRLNVGATKEVGEPLVGAFSAGHSVWFEWEATSTGFVTIGTCGGGFRSVLGVFTGTTVSGLTQVVSGNASEGPRCPFEGREFTFKATGGTDYEIAVDGNAFYLPPAAPPSGEGGFALRIEETPPPPNDDFADATTMEAPIGEEPGGDRFYLADAQGYNWKATTEAGESFYGTNSGASVWYSWTAPENGKYLFGGPCCGGGLNWSLYVGDAVDDLSQLLAATGSAEVTVTAGTTYRIAVWGTPNLATGEPTMGSFSFLISARLPPLPRPAFSGKDGGGSPRDLVAPETTLFKVVLKRKPPIWVFRFGSNEPGSSFQCKLDAKPFGACGSSRTFKHPRPGRHTLRVRAVDASGNVDPSPAVAVFHGRAQGHAKH